MEKDDRCEIWFVTDYTDMIEMSENTGESWLGGINTGWCVGGRCNVPKGEVKVSQAKEYFYSYIKEHNLDNQGYYVLITPEHRFCIMMSGGKIINITDFIYNFYHYRSIKHIRLS